MDFTAHLTVELTASPELLKILNFFTGGRGFLTVLSGESKPGKSALLQCALKDDPTKEETAVQPEQTAAPKEEPAVQPEQTATPKEEPANKPLTLETLRALAAQKDKAKVKKLLSDFDVDKLTSLTPAAYSNFYKRLEEL